MDALPGPAGHGGGGRLGATPEAQAALDAGRLPVRHAALLAETLRFVEDEQVGADLERQLLAAAVSEDAVTFGRTCRRALATVDHEAAERADLRRHRRRSARTWQTEDGFFALSGQWSGIDGETVATAVHAFRRRDAADEDRTPQQVTADAVADMARAALRAGEAPTKHGVRPHVSVVIPWQAVLDGHGAAEASWSGPVPFHEVRRLLADCGVGRLLVDADGVPVEAGEAVRSVPAGLVRVLDQRDGECIGDGCHVPASWCEIMHLDIPYHLQGRLTVDTAGYGCAWHHDRFDRRGWQVTWIGRRPVLHHPDRPPRPGRARDPDRDPSLRSPAVVDRPRGGGAHSERVRPATERPGATTGRRDRARDGRGTGRVQRVVGHRDQPMFGPMSDLAPVDPPGDPP